jgi:hypothetical protein
VEVIALCNIYFQATRRLPLLSSPNIICCQLAAADYPIRREPEGFSSPINNLSLITHQSVIGMQHNILNHVIRDV